jgi:hypothetical protein
MTTTTEAALAEGSGDFGYSLVIEGFPYVLTDWDDLAAVEAAYAGTDWEDVLAGLEVIGGIRQSIEPFKEDLDTPELIFHVMDADGEDTFGKAVFKTKPTISSRIDDVFLPNPDGSGTLTVKENATGPAAFGSSGTVYLGTRAIAFSAKPTAKTFTVPAAGASLFSPFTAGSGNTFALPGSMAQGQNWDIAAPARVSDIPQTWEGKKVALYMHRVVGGVWDTRAQASLRFAGIISEIRDTGTLTAVHCRDLRQHIEQSAIHAKQWRGYVKPGIYLPAGTRFKVSVIRNDMTSSSTDEFVVRSSGASGSDECNAGLYDYSDFLKRLEAWLEADGIDGTWAVYTKLRAAGVRTSFRCRLDGADTIVALQFRCTSVGVLEFMGFGEDYKGSDLDDDWHVVERLNKLDQEAFITSGAPPYRTRALQSRKAYGENQTIKFDAHDGEWWDHRDYLPAGIQGLAADENWSYVVVGESQLAIAEYSSDDELINVTPIAGFGEVYDKVLRDFQAPGVTYDDPADARLEVRQLVFLTGKFSEIMPRLFASIDGRGVNHDDYDAFPSGAGVPWSLLGDDFVNSCKALEEAEGTDTISLRLDRPTKIKDILGAELALRFAFLVFKEGGFRFVSPPLPNATTCDWELDETNKAVGPDDEVPLTTTDITKDFLVNVVNINYRRTHDGKFIDHLTVKDATSIATRGETDADEIDAVNSVSDKASVSGSTVEALAANLMVRMFPMFGKPAKLLRRTIAPTHYGITPGDTVAVTDLVVRDPTTGERGITSRATVCLEVFHDYGELRGEVLLLMSDEDRTCPLAPAAEVDTGYSSGGYTNGYDSTNKRIKLKDHSFSESSADKDVASFAAGDKVRILELDCSNPASPDAWDRDIDSVDVGAGYIQMPTGISSPAWSGATKKFVVIPQGYAAVQDSQKLGTFQADNFDGLIADSVEENLYGQQTVLGYSNGVATDLPALLADECFGDGKPLTPFQLEYFVRGANNLLNYKTATHVPLQVWRDGSGANSCEDMATDATEWQLHLMVPVYIGGLQIAGRTRYLSVAPQFRSEGGATAYVRVTSSRFPPVGLGLSDPDWRFIEPARSVEFSTTSTTLVTATPQNLLPVAAQIPGHTWLSISLKGTGGDVVRCSGLPILYLKALS